MEGQCGEGFPQMDSQSMRMGLASQNRPEEQTKTKKDAEKEEQKMQKGSAVHIVHLEGQQES